VPKTKEKKKRASYTVGDKKMTFKGDRHQNERTVWRGSPQNANRLKAKEGTIRVSRGGKRGTPFRQVYADGILQDVAKPKKRKKKKRMSGGGQKRLVRGQQT